MSRARVRLAKRIHEGLRALYDRDVHGPDAEEIRLAYRELKGRYSFQTAARLAELRWLLKVLS